MQAAFSALSSLESAQLPTRLATASAASDILDTVSGEHDVSVLVGLLRRDGNLTLVGAPAKPIELEAFGLIVGRHSVSGSNIGGITETQEMLDFWANENSPPMSKQLQSRR